MYTQFEWERKFFMLGRCCYYCGHPLILKQATVDHLQPQSRGGEDTILNVVPACMSCNRRKGTLTAEEFRASFPKLCTASTANSTLKSEGVTLCYEENDEPRLLKRMISEREKISWAWSHPA